MPAGERDEALRLRGQGEEAFAVVDRDDVVGTGVEKELGHGEPADLLSLSKRFRAMSRTGSQG